MSDRSDDVDLWVKTAEAVLSRGASLDAAITMADRVISAYWRRHGQDQGQHPGLAKCAIGLRRTATA